MTRVKIVPGICGFTCLISTRVNEVKTVNVYLGSACKNVSALGKALKELTIHELFRNPFNQNLIYARAGECNLHPSCPIPCAIAKAAEIELKLALPADVMITFIE